MKLSIAWIFDHINADYRSIDIPALIAKLNETTAEIERSYPVVTDLKNMAIATITEVGDQVTARSDEWRSAHISLPARSHLHKGHQYLIVKEGDTYRWATSLDFGGHKEMALPSVYSRSKWKNKCQEYDYIFEIDNKSINHRPDLWGHRGFAREIAAILNVSLKPLTKFCASIPVIARSKTKDSWHIEMSADHGCKRLAALYLPSIELTASLPWMVSRLSRVDSRSINAIVDCTNYVMLDISQPMHAFDAAKLNGKKLQARMAYDQEKLVLLDNQIAQLTSNDIVIADTKGPVALAGIMGGKESAVSDRTTAILIESANFDPAMIRRSSTRHKIRTEASARFEKSLDPDQNVTAILRYMKLLDECKIRYGATESIISCGAAVKAPVISMRHSFIEYRLGVTIARSFVTTTLKKLAFEVHSQKKGTDYLYQITVPTFRATKDVLIPEDIVEEIARFFGYSNIPKKLPMITTKAADQYDTIMQYRIKELLAFGLSMREVATYAFFDESFLTTIGWQPTVPTAQVKDPVSHNWYRLATTLMPALFKAALDNHTMHEELRFFEWARTWYQADDIHENKVLTGIFYKKSGLSFYDVKAEIEKLFTFLSLPVTWSHAGDTGYPWFDYDQTALISVHGKTLGLLGMVDRTFMGKNMPGCAALFEFDAQQLLDFRKPTTHFEPLPKYPAISRDISMMAPLSLTVDQITTTIMAVDSRIRAAQLIDMFQKKEWQHERALTFSFVMRDMQGTMVKQQADEITQKVIAAVSALGAVIR